MPFTYSTGTITVQHWSICPILVQISIFCHGINQALAFTTIHGQPFPHPNYCGVPRWTNVPTCWANMLDTSEGAPFNAVMWQESLLLAQNSSVSRFSFLFYFSIPYTHFVYFMLLISTVRSFRHFSFNLYDEGNPNYCMPLVIQLRWDRMSVNYPCITHNVYCHLPTFVTELQDCRSV
jgi:hypothetical protein